MIKTIRKFTSEEFLAAISTSSEATKHSKGFILVYFQKYLAIVLSLLSTAKLQKIFYISKFPNGISPKILVFQDNLHKFAEKNTKNLQISDFFRTFALNN